MAQIETSPISNHAMFKRPNILLQGIYMSLNPHKLVTDFSCCLSVLRCVNVCKLMPSHHSPCHKTTNYTHIFHSH